MVYGDMMRTTYNQQLLYLIIINVFFWEVSKTPCTCVTTREKVSKDLWLFCRDKEVSVLEPAEMNQKEAEEPVSRWVIHYVSAGRVVNSKLCRPTVAPLSTRLYRQHSATWRPECVTSHHPNKPSRGCVLAPIPIYTLTPFIGGRMQVQGALCCIFSTWPFEIWRHLIEQLFFHLR